LSALRSLAIAAVALVGATTSFAQSPAAVANCSQLEVATIAPARIPDEVWDAMPSFTVVIRFRIDPSDGSPRDIESRLAGPVRDSARPIDENLLIQLATDAMTRYRFCTPEGFDRWAPNRVALRFTPLRAKRLYVQGFEPFYARGDLRAGRTGKAIAQGVFDVSGVMKSADILTSSGDAALDRKVLGALRSDRLITSNGEPLDKPLTFSQSFEFQIK
jgi:hypothetical protein